MLAFVSQLSKYACLWLKQHWTPHSLESVMRSPRTTNPDFKDSAEINDLNGLWETCHGFISCLPSFGVCLDSQVRNLCSHSPPSVGYFWWVIYREVSAVLLALFPFLSSSSFSLTLFLSLSLFPSLSHTHIIKKETIGNVSVQCKVRVSCFNLLFLSRSRHSKGREKKRRLKG